MEVKFVISNKKLHDFLLKARCNTLEINYEINLQTIKTSAYFSWKMERKVFSICVIRAYSLSIAVMNIVLTRANKNHGVW